MCLPFPCLPPFLGGGSQRLFRKVGSKSSIYSTESSVRSAGSYIYEDFMPTDGTDVKVPTYLRCSNVYKEASINHTRRQILGLILIESSLPPSLYIGLFSLELQFGWYKI